MVKSFYADRTLILKGVSRRGAENAENFNVYEYGFKIKDKRPCLSLRTPRLCEKYAFRDFFIATISPRHPSQQQSENVKYHKPLSDFNMILLVRKNKDRACMRG
jgi:hypothetical protein